MHRRLLTGVFLACAAVAAQAVDERFVEQYWPRTDLDKRAIPLSEVISGGPPKDGIPAVDQPQFDSVVEARDWLSAKEPVIAVAEGDVAKAYPIQILIWHEIVNDRVDGPSHRGDLLSPVQCFNGVRPPTGRYATGFRRQRPAALSDMIMYDRQTESWWQQFNGEGIVGEHTGRVLERVPSRIVAFEQFAANFPNGRVLNRDTGPSRRYGQNPCYGYDSIEQHPFLFDGKVDPRLAPMTRIIGIVVDDARKIYPFTVFETQAVINDEVGGLPVVVMSEQDATFSPLDQDSISDSRTIPAATAYDRRLGERVLVFEPREGGVFDQQTGSRWNLFGEAVAGPLQGERLGAIDASVHFAFAWLAFSPDSEIYRTEE